MEEKERYECKYNEKLMKHYTFDNENKEELGYKGVVRVLNQQNKQIKELNTKLVEEMELSAERRQIIEDLTIENNQQDKEIEELNEKLQDKVADLEAKLAESEKNYKDARELGIEQFHSLKEIINSSQEEIDKLKQQLAEKDKEIKQLKQSQKQLAIEKLTMFEAMLSRAVQWDNDSKCWTISEEVFGNFIVQIDEKIEELKGEETI